MKIYRVIRLFLIVICLALPARRLFAQNGNGDFENSPLAAAADSRMEKSLVCRFETIGTFGKGDYAPFWFTSNRQGLSSHKPESGYIRIAADGSMILSDDFGVGYGLDVGVAYGLQADCFIHQFYTDVNYRWIGMSIGSREIWGELKNSLLSSGALTWSGNSRPVPQVRIGIPEFTRISLLGSWFSVKGHVAYGVYTDSKWRSRNPDEPYTDRIKYHSKSAFLRFGNIERSPFHATLGLEMYSQFGGIMHNRKLFVDDEVMEEYRLPDGPKTYWNILMPFNRAGEQTKENGNSLGSWHLSLDYIGETWGIRSYYEHFYEDHSGMLGIEYKSDMLGNKDYVFYGLRRNWFDGLYGLEFNLPKEWPVRGVVLEILNTRGQSGPVYKYPSANVLEEVDGRDGFYTHELYDSYSHWGYAIGSPMPVSPVYNADGDQRFKSNRLLMFHAGIDGCIGPRFDYRILISTSHHWGTYEDPYNEVGRLDSYLLEGFYRLGEECSWKIGLSLGFDSGKGTPIGSNKGVMLSISRLWRII